MLDFYGGIEGKIVYLDSRGWGFINSEVIEFEKIYFHWSALKQGLNFKTLKKGDILVFNAHKKEDKGWKAINIRLKNNDLPKIDRD